MKRSLAYLMSADMIAQSNRELGNNIIRSNRELGEKLKSISDAEIESRDRVNISLKEYKDMQNKIRSLSHEVDRLTNILNKIEIPLDENIVADSIVTYWCDNHADFKRKFRIEFDVDMLHSYL